MAAVLLKLTGLDELGGDAQLDPPDGQLGEAAEGRRGEGMTVVAANALGEAVLLEETLELSSGPLDLKGREPSAGQEAGSTRGQ